MEIWKARSKCITMMILGWGAVALLNPQVVQSRCLDCNRTVLPPPAEFFQGKIAPTASNATAAFPQQITAPAEAPNVLLIMSDDVGFGVAGTFGGPVPTPHLDRLAQNGLTYNRFHTTALCSPTRAALLTGRNHHTVGMGVITDMVTGFPGYNSIIPRSAATIAEVLRQHGYNTAMFGKHHNVPMWEMSTAGPFDHWPTGLGFEYFYGFIGGETNQWSPALVRGTTRVSQPDVGRQDSILDRFLADDAIHWIHEQKAVAPDKPFFIYYAPGSGHSPHQAPADWIAKFRGKFDEGWDSVRYKIVSRQKDSGLIPPTTEVSPRPADLPAWISLAPDQQRVAARMMEVYAGMIAYQDDQIGRVLDEIDRIGQAENTLVIFIEGDNGASAEGSIDGSTNWFATLTRDSHEDQAWRLSQLDLLGGPETYEHFPAAWAWSLDAPFPWFKTIASHLGGTRNPLVVSWPRRIKHSGIRSQFHSVTDVMPTILEAAGLPTPTSVNGVGQQRMDGISFAYSFDSAGTTGLRHTQYFEMFGNRGIYHDGWWAGTTPQHFAWPSKLSFPDITKWPWELYNIDEDFAQTKDIATAYPDKLKFLQDLWMQEAVNNNVLPLDDSTYTRLRKNPHKAQRSEYTYWGGDLRIPDDLAPGIREHSFAVTADVSTSVGEGNGVLLASGGQFGGWSFYLKDGRPVVTHTASQQPADQFSVQSNIRIPSGSTRIFYSVTYTVSEQGRRAAVLIAVNGVEVAHGSIDRTARSQAETTETFDIGNDTGSLVSKEYGVSPRFDGVIDKIVVSM